MIDLKKPLDGAAGLLLLASLVIFGAIMGVSLALMLSWLEMKDSLANFLGGALGAGLGAALAVRGSVYLYERGRREDRAPIAAELHATLDEIIVALRYLRSVADTYHDPGAGPPGMPMVEVIGAAQTLSNYASELFAGRYLTKPINSATKHLRQHIFDVRDAVNKCVATPSDAMLPTPAQLDEVIQLAESLRQQVEAQE